ncbi:MAG: aminopeptidase P family protein [Verrucomicrobia bacterium]|nr:aminopeptidase P family protein [Verrucomicrobiota bacterium]MBV8379005.1 aminopeptidase P family protein [Verrucomicrobiota bacterium]
MTQSLPFSSTKLDDLLDRAGADVLFASSKHNVQYLLGGYRYFFFEHSAAIGLGHYLPVMGYVKGRQDLAFYVGGGDEGWGLEVFPIWPERVATVSWAAPASALVAAEFLKSAGFLAPRIALEPELWPVAAGEVLGTELPGATFIDATELLEELRAVKNQAELNDLKNAAAGLVDSMVATFQWIRLGVTETEIVHQLRLEQTLRGLDYQFALITTGPTFGRAPSQRRIAKDEIVSLDTGGRHRGYLADMARMGVLGEPTPLMKDLLDEILSIQAAARRAIKPGTVGGEIYRTALQTLESCPHRSEMHFVAHGIGLIAHEAPRLTATGPIPYADKHAQRPLESGMVISIETHVTHPDVGFVKLEDTVAVTDSGWEAFGDWGRGWNVPNPASVG